MSKLFAKWLPVAGSIEIGDKVLVNKPDGEQELFTRIVSHTDWKDFESLTGKISLQLDRNKEYVSSYDPKTVKSVKLFLCSRDIRAGEEVTSDGLLFLRIESETHAKEITKHSPSLFKIIGEISPDAYSFVTEGQEFENDDLLICSLAMIDGKHALTSNIEALKYLDSAIGREKRIAESIIKIKDSNGVFR